MLDIQIQVHEMLYFFSLKKTQLLEEFGAGFFYFINYKLIFLLGILLGPGILGPNFIM